MRSGSAISSIAATFPAVIVKLNTTRGLPRCIHTAPAAPSTSAGRAASARPEKVPATARAPTTSRSAPIRAAASSARSTMSDTRATIVVSQPPRFSTPPAPARLTRSQASCAASSASLAEPSTR
jgi:hypothetical protein